MIDQKKLEESGWEFRDSESYNCVEFKSPRMKDFESFYMFELSDNGALIAWEFECFMNQVRRNVFNQFHEAYNNTCAQLMILARKNLTLEKRLKITIEVYP